MAWTGHAAAQVDQRIEMHGQQWRLHFVLGGPPPAVVNRGIFLGAKTRVHGTLAAAMRLITAA